ncbi:MAG TPA: hypothetical protein VF630_08875, partial [Hymenobacter sp.]
TCLIINSKNADGTPASSPAGIGLRNVRQRLQLLYPQRHCLEVEARPDTFTVRLTLPLSGAAGATASVPARPVAVRPAERAAPSTQLLPAHENAA